MQARFGLVTTLSMLALACNRPTDAPSQAPTADATTPEPEPTPPKPTPGPSDPADVLDELDEGDEPDPPASPRPEPIEVTVDAVMTAQKPDATPLMVGVDPRFTLNMKIVGVEPETPLLPLGQYDVLIHSPSKTFRGPVPGKGERIRFKMTIFPEDPNDPHDEVFFADLWIE